MGSPSWIGADLPGVQDWKSQLDSAHEQVIEALTRYRTVAQQNNQVAHGANFQRLSSECEEITSKHIADHTNLHTDYTADTDKLVNALRDITGG
jgi:predicted RNA-binding protein with PIN domain